MVYNGISIGSEHIPSGEKHTNSSLATLRGAAT